MSRIVVSQHPPLALAENKQRNELCLVTVKEQKEGLWKKAERPKCLFSEIRICFLAIYGDN